MVVHGDKLELTFVCTWTPVFAEEQAQSSP
jgi:hypothetical protein